MMRGKSLPLLITRWRLSRILFISCLFLLTDVEKPFAQSLTWEDFVERMTVDEEREQSSWEHLYEELAERHAHPFNLNEVTREQLETLPFLSPSQIEELLAYVYVHKPVLTLSELQLVKGLDFDTRAMLALFVRAGDGEGGERLSAPLRWANLCKYGEHEVVARMDIPFYYRKGYYQYPPDVLEQYPNRRYLGARFYHSVRYQYNYGTRLSAGLVAENDAGEPFFRHGNKGYDFYSYYFLLHDVGRMQTLALGNYRLNFGQGLVVNNQFTLGKQSVLEGIYSRNKGIRKHSSTSEDDYLRGAASTWQFGRMALTGFYSFRERDATLKDGFITSLKTDGYHRTPLEMSKKNNVRNHLAGFHLSYESPTFNIGLTGVYTVFNRAFKPSRSYQQYDPHGREFAALGVDYRWDGHRLSFIGETAVGGNGAAATLNALAYRFSPAFSVLLLHRYYAKDFEGIHARAFEEGGRVRNEHGAYVGAELLLGDRLKATAYVDCFRFPAPKYGVSVSGSRGVEVFTQFTGRAGKSVDWLLRYRFKSKGKDFTLEDDGGHGVAPNNRHTAKAQLRWQAVSGWLLKTTLDYVHTSFITNGKEQGYQLSQSVGWQPSAKRFRCEAGGSYFHTDSYDTRVYSYERGLLYAFSFPSNYGHGVHAYLWGSWDMNRLFTVICKYVYTGYFDRDHIGSGTQEIEGRHRQDLQLQVRVRF